MLISVQLTACVTIVLPLFLGILATHRERKHHPVFTRDFAVELEDDGDEAVADLVASVYGFTVVKRLVNLGNVYYFQHDDVPHRSKRSAEKYVSALQEDPNVKRVEQQRLLERKKRVLPETDELIEQIMNKPDHHESLAAEELKRKILAEIKAAEEIPSQKRSEDIDSGGEEMEESQRGQSFLFNDPQFPNQWYLQEDKRSRRSLKSLDLNLGAVWEQGITGQGVVVTVMDDGIQYTHPDLKKNYDAKASTDLNDPSDLEGDPMPNTDVAGNGHGTKCAGEIAAEANNKVCGVGVAFNCRIGGIRMLDGPITDILESDSVSYALDYIDVYSASWGPTDNGKIMELPGYYCQKALEAGIKKGRKGLGAIYVWATGNGGINDDNCNCDGYVSSVYTLSVGSVTKNGMSTYYSEVCASTLAVVYTGGPHTTSGIREFGISPHAVVTTDLDEGCTHTFVGTSGAAPLAAGCVALTLEANPNVTWRDVQHIVVESSRIPNGEELVWTINGAGRHVSHQFGFGMMDCGRMVELAQNWTNVPPQHICVVPDKNITETLPPQGSVNLTLQTDACSSDVPNSIDKLEHVEAVIKMNHTYRGDVKLVLTSPAGTRSTILRTRNLDDEDDGIDFKFMSVHFWGENPRGTWSLMVSDSPPKHSFRKNQGCIHYFALILYGTSDSPDVEKSGMNKRAAKAHKASKSDVDDIMVQEKSVSSGVRIKRLVKKNLKTGEGDNSKTYGVQNENKDGDSLSESVRKVSPEVPSERHKISQNKIDNDPNIKIMKEIAKIYSHSKKELPVHRDEYSYDQTSIHEQRERLLQALGERGYTEEDFIWALDQLIKKISRKIKEKTEEEKHGQRSEDLESSQIQDSSASRGHSEVRTEQDITKDSGPNGKTDLGNTDKFSRATDEPFDQNDAKEFSRISDKSFPKYDSANQEESVETSHEMFKEKLLAELRKRLNEWHKNNANP